MREFNLILLLLFSGCIMLTEASGRSFLIDYENDTFLKDGKPYRYKHY